LKPIFKIRYFPFRRKNFEHQVFEEAVSRVEVLCFLRGVFITLTVRGF